MDPGSHLAALDAASAALAEVAAGNLDQPVPACPGWDVGDLLAHLGGVYGYAAAAVAGGGQRPSGARAQPPESRGELIGWFRQQRGSLLSAFAASDPDGPAWIFSGPGPGTAGWWRRRQAMETAVHLCDVQQAAGAEVTLAADVAADGIDELLTVMLPARLSRKPVDALQGTFHVHCTDTEGEWFVDFSAPDLGVRREHAKAATAARGPAAGLYLWLWNRRSPEAAGIEVFGDGSLVVKWRETAI